MTSIFRGYRDKTGAMLSLTESARPLFSTFLLFSLTIIWAKCSSYDVLARHTRIFYWVSGTAFSNIVVSIILLVSAFNKSELVCWFVLDVTSLLDGISVYIERFLRGRKTRNVIEERKM